MANDDLKQRLSPYTALTGLLGQSSEDYSKHIKQPIEKAVTNPLIENVVNPTMDQLALTKRITGEESPAEYAAKGVAQDVVREATDPVNLALLASGAGAKGVQALGKTGKSFPTAARIGALKKSVKADRIKEGEKLGQYLRKKHGLGENPKEVIIGGESRPLAAPTAIRGGNLETAADLSPEELKKMIQHYDKQVLRESVDKLKKMSPDEARDYIRTFSPDDLKQIQEIWKIK